MDPIIPIVSAVLQASSATIDKVALSIKKITYKTYTSISFPLILLFNFIIFLILAPPLHISLFSWHSIILILISSVTAIIGNLLYYKALKNALLNEMDIISLLGNIPLILLTALIFASERAHPLVIALALISSAAIIWSHWQKNHFQIARKILWYLLFVVLISPFRGIISKVLLQSWNPISLQLISSIIPAIFFGIYFFKSDKNCNFKAFLLLLATNLLSTVAWILYFFSYQKFGIIYTVLIFSLQPLLVYIAALFLLREKFHWKKFIAFLIVLASILVAQVI